MKKALYQNKYNPQKYLIVHVYKCRHTVARQYIVTFMGAQKIGKFVRLNKNRISELTGDYTLVREA